MAERFLGLSKVVDSKGSGESRLQGWDLSMWLGRPACTTFLLLAGPLSTEQEILGCGFCPLELNWSAFPTRLGATPSQDWV